MLLRRPVGNRRGPGLLGSMARTAVVAGTATATAGAVHRWSERKQAEAAEAQAAQEAVHDQQAQDDQHVEAGEAQADRPVQSAAEAAQPTRSAAPRATSTPPASAVVGGVDLMSQLRQLADLRAAGVLTEAEFTAAKAKLLGT
ncbi:SHOCT domain-containing protein [Catellatospora aurea]|uniref:SHOCT domain-containing protein n=1 Tax=Catellatospora aurea TaxID=1337874 RepID=A0ABW2H862_9ACTN